MKIGYARVSTKDQKLELQKSALKDFGCDLILEEKQSALKYRRELERLLSKVRTGDIVVVWKIDRLGRSLRELINIVNRFRESGIEFVSLSDNINTTTAQGRFVFNLFASFAEFERELISERTKAGLAEALKNGRKGGRPPGLSPTAKKTAWALYHMNEKGKYSVSEIMKTLNLNKATYYRYLKWAEKEVEIKVTKKG